ncbi:hypothetical protein BBJ28_00008644 [Nothophytophthora sp. Chile5]|nr:hypothetical protein BBJ28_00008644 [Nothophytophthora sp. Chile5]
MSKSSAPAGGYEAFGSFHTPSTAALFASDDVVDVDVHLPPLPSTLAASSLLQPEAARSLFALDLETWTFLNHGAFGSPTRFATETAAAWRSLADAQPLRFHDRELFPLIVQAIKALAKFIGVSHPEQLVLLPNATSGLHAVLASVLAAESKALDQPTVLLFSTRYGAVRKMLTAIQGDKTSNIHVHEEPLSLAESYDDEKVLKRLKSALDAVEASGRRVALVVVDHITSNTAVTLPVQAIVQHCHTRGHRIPVLVDGAHALLNLPLNVEAVGADYYVGNCHKWFCSPRGAAFLHIATDSGPSIEPRVVSHGFFDGMQSAFMWTGLQDYSPWLALPQCLAFWQRLGIQDTRKHMHSLAQNAAELLYSKWEMPAHLERERTLPMHKRHAMRLVQLPTARRLCGDVIVDEKEPKATSTHAKRVQDALHRLHHIEVPVKCVDGRLYVRLSAHIYNSLADYERLALAVVQQD